MTSITSSVLVSGSGSKAAAAIAASLAVDETVLRTLNCKLRDCGARLALPLGKRSIAMLNFVMLDFVIVHVLCKYGVD